MMKKKLTALAAVLLICLLLFPTAAFAYASDGESTPTEPPTTQSADAAAPADPTEQTDESDSGDDNTLPFDTDILTTLLAGMDPEILEVLKEHPKLIAMLLPTMHVTVRDGSITISVDKQDEEDPGQTGTVVTQGSNLNVRTGPSTGYDIITQLTNGSSVKVIGEKDGWYQIEIPARFGYVCGEYLRVNDIPSTQTDDGYSFDIDQATILSFLELFQDMMQPAETQTGHGLTPSGNLTLVDDYGERNGEGQQFVTLVTKNGNYFYLIIDRDEKGEETVHFLNLVDERDLFALMEDDEKADYESQMAAEQAAREAAEKAAAEAASQTGESETQKPDDEPAKEGKKTNMAPILIIIVLMAAAGGAWFFMQTKKKKKAADAPDPDADYTDDDEEDYGAGPSCPYLQDKEADEDPYENEILEADALPFPADFDFDKYLQTSFRMYGTKFTTVDLICKNDVMDAILDKFGKDVTTYCYDMENFRAEVDVVPSSVFYSWVFGFGGDVVINGPANVKEEYKQLVQKVADKLKA